MVKYLLIVGIWIAGLSTVQAQDAEEVPMDSIPFMIRKEAYLYSMALKYNDLAVARMSLYNLIVLDPGNVALYDSLAILYFDSQKYASAALVAQDAMALNPNDAFAMELAAVSFDQIGAKAKAVEAYEKLYLSKDDMGTLYRVAFLQLDLKRYSEAMQNADIIIASKQSENLQILFPTKENKQQEVSLKVAAIRLKAMVEQARGNKALARDFFQKALDIQPGFYLVQEQLAALDK